MKYRELFQETQTLLEGLSALESLPQNQARREKTVEFLCLETGTKFGFWSWGHGHAGESMLPVAIFPHGLNQAELSTFYQLSMNPESNEWIRNPMLPALQFSKQSCGMRTDFWSDEQWRNSPYRKQLQQIGLDEWLVCVRYESDSVWSCICLMKATDHPPFSEPERVAVELAFTCFRWLRCDTSETDIGTDVPVLSIRNKEVLYLLLDGLSRKEIAARMGITLHIVNDCIKQIYNHFGTSSATELAALFIKGK